MKTSQLLTTISLITSAVSASYTYKGCYKLSSLSTTLQSKGKYIYQTNSYCQGLCSGYAVAATYNSGYCYCGDSLPDDLETGECTATCFGYSTDICGSSDSLSVYVDLSLLEESEDESSSTSTSTTSTSTSDSTSSTTTSTSSTTSSTSSTSTTTLSSTPTTTTTSATTEEATSTTQPASQSAAQSTTTLAPSQTTIIYNIIQSYEGQTLMVTSTVDESSASASAAATGSSTSDSKKSNNNKSTNSGLSNGAKIGIIVGCIVGFLIIAAVIIVVIFYKRQSEDEDEDEKSRESSAGKHASRQASVRQGKQFNGSGGGSDSDDDFDDSFSTTNVSDNSHMVPHSAIPGLPAKPQAQAHAYKSFAGAGNLGSNNVNDNGHDFQIYSPPTAMSNADDYDYRKRFSDLSLPDERKLRVVNPDSHEDTLENHDESGYFDSYYENNDDNSTLDGH